MNKNYIFVLGIVIIAIAVIGVVVLYQFPSMALDQIIKNKDCASLDKWEEEHMFDDDLNVSSEQLSASMSLATECVGKALGNMFGNSALSTDTTDPILILDEILNNRDCDGLRYWGEDHIFINKDFTVDVWGIEDIFISKDITLNIKQQLDIEKLSLECTSKELENFLKESALSTDTTDSMVVLGKILNNRDCDGLEVWLKDHNEYSKDLKIVISIEVVDFKDECKIK